MKNQDNLRELSDNIKGNNLYIIGVPEGEDTGQEKIFEEIIAPNFHNMGNKSITEVQEVH